MNYFVKTVIIYQFIKRERLPFVFRQCGDFMFTVFLAKTVSVLLAVIMFITAPVNFLFGKRTKKIEDAEENCRLSFAAISDMHLDEKASFISDGMLELGFMDMDKAKDRLDAVVFDGDITNHGYFEQWDIFASSVARHNISDNLFIVTGNHDTWGPNRDDFTNPVDGVLPTFIKYNRTVSDRNISNMYYSGIVNGYCFICLGSEHDNTCAYLSDKQLDWFAREMKKASAAGLPVFVFCHQPLNGTHGLPYNWGLDKKDPPDEGGIGDQSDAVAAVLKKYDNVFYISGHIHAGLKRASAKLGVDYASVEYMENNNGNKVTLINLPCFANPDVLRLGHVSNGCGFVVEAYDSHVLLRARNFGAGTWLTRYDVSVELV